MVEFAIVAPVLVSLVMFATYFADAWDFKLKNQEAARFAAWEFTAFPLSDYVNNDHAALYDKAKSQIQSDLNTLYADFDSAQDSAPTTSFVGTHELEMPKVQFENLDAPLDSSKTLSELPGFGSEASSLLGALNGTLSTFGPQGYGFDMKGMVKVTVTSKFTNKLIPDKFLGQMRYGQINTWETSDSVALVADGWTLHDGRDAVVDSSNTSPARINGSGPIHPLAYQVDRMSFLGFKDKLIPSSVQSGISTVESFLGGTFPDPLFLFAGPHGAPVVSLNYRRDQGSDSYTYVDGSAGDQARHGEVDFKKTGRKMDSGSQNGFHTIPFYVTWDYDTSPLSMIFNQSASFYMGCKSAEAPDSLTCH